MILIFAETENGQLKKAATEALTYGAQIARETGVPAAALVLGSAADPAHAGQYGVQKVLHMEHEHLTAFDAQVFTAAITEVARQQGATAVILPHSAMGKTIAGRIAVRLQAGIVSGVTEVPTFDGNAWQVRKGVFSGKAFAYYRIDTNVKVLTLMGNAVKPVEAPDNATLEKISLDLPAPRTTVKGIDKVEGLVPLPEAERVVSGGRGLKGPENWGVLEELANVLKATTACSRPVSDSGWRPHHEHVGQTGIAIRPTLYIAIGISGAIQHLAGVNRSKVIVVINKDPEAPFFKAADYGVVGDLFEVVPRLTEAIKRAQAS
jgi:electron transfer flavoprotein alpha subunit